MKTHTLLPEPATERRIRTLAVELTVEGVDEWSFAGLDQRSYIGNQHDIDQ